MQQRQVLSKLISTLFLLTAPAVGNAQQSDAKQESKRLLEKRVYRLVEHLAEDWHYSNTSEDLGGGTYCIRTSIQKCEDDYATVRQHYFEKFGFDVEYEPLPKKMYRQMREDETGVYLWDDRLSGVDGRVEHIRTFFVFTTPDYSITGIIAPTEDGAPPVIQMTICVDPTTDIDVPPVDDNGKSGDSGF